jgi:thioredoxin-related protein
MDVKRLFIVLITLLSVSLLYAQGKGKTTDEILSESFKQAGKEKKNVFVIFHASWCYWCHKMDTAMNDPVVKPFFDKNFIIRHLVVYESPNKKDLETPGALELLTKYKGNDEGIPYWLIFDSNGKLLEDSKDDSGKNSGCPASKEEVEYFITVLKRTSRINDEDALIITKRFRQNEAKPQ